MQLLAEGFAMLMVRCLNIEKIWSFMSSEQRTVLCKKLNKQLPALEKPPLKGPIGEKIFKNISAEAWSMWKNDMQIKVLNEYRLNMGDQKDYQFLVHQMELFLNLKEGETVEVENAERGKS
jgi:Fe-S cluster biosynthesis and repair protein YggX